MPTVQQTLDKAPPHALSDMLRKVRDLGGQGLGAILAALRPRTTAFTGLTSSATQVHDKRSMIFSVEAVAGTPLARITGGSPDAGEVSVDYDDNGLPTIEFNAAVTAYTVVETGDLGDLATAMAAEAQASV